MATRTTKKAVKVKKQEENGFEQSVEELEKDGRTDGDSTEAKEESAKPEKANGKTNAAPNTDETLDLGELKDMSISELTHIAKEMGIEGATGLRKQELIFKVLAAQTEKSGFIFSEG
ncbi:MAG TPA: Rho termination factor N-terminal domain-containing protein, partial [Pyrinomonadaceae bacterium]|nr:Rho termination factor N-terminal domain-containing protein [Pyrinomonadaceae bacterium]